MLGRPANSDGWMRSSYSLEIIVGRYSERCAHRPIYQGTARRDTKVTKIAKQRRPQEGLAAGGSGTKHIRQGLWKIVADQ